MKSTNNKSTKISKRQWNRQPFETKSDSEIAKLLGVSRQRVFQKRQEKNIPTRTPKKQIIINSGLLGKVHDSVIAKRFNVSMTWVSNVRKEEGIAAVRSNTYSNRIVDILKKKPGLNAREVSLMLFADVEVKNERTCYTAMQYLHKLGRIERESLGRYRVCETLEGE